MKNKTELLAPAGSFDVMKACISAGADAVYMGLSKFSARAYADNADDARYIEAIDYAHLHGKKLYLTINTLFKEHELFDELYDTLKPLYEAGLDAVIVQDLGVMRFVREHFPELPLHVSTQATVTGPESAAFYKETLGASRVVPARELSLSEIRSIYERTGMEIECFVHGALCYSYSGQCLFSSIVGGRSGNRGRCAQPCRMPYEVLSDGRSIGSENRTGNSNGRSGRENPGNARFSARGSTKHGKELSQERGKERGKELRETRDHAQSVRKNAPRESGVYCLSLKDLNALRRLPEMIEAGVCSLKIEGRMKKAEYAAGVTSIYRKYLDLYENAGRKGYHVDPADEKLLFDLFNRNGFTDGYFGRHNGKEMLTLTPPDFREENRELTEAIRASFIKCEHTVSAEGVYAFAPGLPGSLTVSCELDGRRFTGEAKTPENIAEATGTPADRESVEARLMKTGGSGYSFEALSGQIDGNVFLPVSILNALRREALAKLSEGILSAYRRTVSADRRAEFPEEKTELFERRTENPKASFVFSALVRTEDQFMAAVSSPGIAELLLESTTTEADGYKAFVSRARAAGKKTVLVFPQIFRTEARSWLEGAAEAVLDAGFDGFMVRNIETLGLLKKLFPEVPVLADHTLYAFNTMASRELKDMGITRLTVPVELNRREILETGFSGQEMILYGRLPMMVTANCIRRTMMDCDRKKTVLTLKDRMGNELPVINECRYCLNTIYNGLPVSLLSELEEISRFGLAAGRLEFTTESGEAAASVIRTFTEAYQYRTPAERSGAAFTRGHFRRGVE